MSFPPAVDYYKLYLVVRSITSQQIVVYKKVDNFFTKFIPHFYKFS